MYVYTAHHERHERVTDKGHEKILSVSNGGMPGSVGMIGGF